MSCLLLSELELYELYYITMYNSVNIYSYRNLEFNFTREFLQISQ